MGLSVYVGLTLWLVFRAMFFPYTLDYGEGDVFWFTHKLAHGLNIYTPLGGPPFDSANYPPVAMLLTAILFPVFGDTLTFGRWLNFAAALIVVAFLIRFVRAETKSARIAFTVAALFLGSTFVYHWIPLYRVDLIGLAFTFAGVFCVWRWEKARESQTLPSAGRISSELKLIFAGVFFLLALYTKHSLFLAPSAASLAIFLRDRRAASLFIIGLVVSGGAIFLLLDFLTRGGWTFGILMLNATVWTPRVFVPLVQSFITTYAVILILAAWGWLSKVRSSGLGVLPIYAILSLVSIVLAGREGAWENYFLEVIAMALLHAGIAIASVDNSFRWGWVLPISLFLQLALFWNDHDPRIAQKLFDEVRAGNERVGKLVREARGTVIAEDMGLLWGNGKPVEYYSFVYSTLARAGKYDQKWEVNNLRAGNFPLVILNQGTRQDVDHFGNFTRGFVSALDYGYAVSGADPRYVVYAPAPLQHFEPRATFDSTLELMGWSLVPDELRGGNDMTLTIVWRALKTTGVNYTTFAHLESANGSKLAQDDHAPANGAYPTTHWAQDEMVRETYHLRLPSSVPLGDYALRVGWYDALTQDRLSLPDGADVVELKTWRVR